jgi:predicted ester cyclase
MTDTEKSNKEVVLRFNREVIEKGDINAVMELIHPDFINHNLPPGAQQGPQGMINFITGILHKAFAGISVEILDQVVEDTKVVSRKVINATHTESFMGIAASGKRIALPIIDIVALQNRQYMEHWS